MGLIYNLSHLSNLYKMFFMGKDLSINQLLTLNKSTESRFLKFYLQYISASGIAIFRLGTKIFENEKSFTTLIKMLIKCSYSELGLGWFG